MHSHSFVSRRTNGERQKNICILTSVHSALDVRIFEKQARSLAAAGFRVTVIAPHADDCLLDGVEVEAIALPKNRLERMTRTMWSVYCAAVRNRAAVYHFHDPELIPIGVLLKFRGARVIYDVHEDVPQDVLTDKDWVPRGLRMMASKLSALAEGCGSLFFDWIVAATPAIGRKFPIEKTVVVQNYPHIAPKPAGIAPPYDKREPIATYVGGITVRRSAREMTGAIALVPESLGARLRLVGVFDPPNLKEELGRQPGWSRTDYLGWLSRDGVHRVLSESRLGLVLFHPLALYKEAQPNKLFEYMAAGLPIVASDFPLWREIIEGEGCGLLVDPLDPQAIASAIEWILEHPHEAEEMGKRGAEAVTTKYNWQAEEKKLLGMYQKLTGETGRDIR